jgi:FMN-dependent NADH-azoreductase
MRNILLIHSSIFGAQSQSLALAREFLTRFPAASVVERTLTPESIPHLTAETMAAMATPEAQRTERQNEVVALSDTLIAEVEAADTIVLAVPMYNFSIPSTLKAWIDHVARAGRTFRYTTAGPEGLLKGKKVFVVTARGGIYSEGPAATFDFQEPYLRTVLGFLGLNDVSFVHLEGLKISPEAAASGLARARAKIETLIPRRAAAA